MNSAVKGIFLAFLWSVTNTHVIAQSNNLGKYNSDTP